MQANAIGTRCTEIMQIATRLFLENGFSGTSMSQVSAACGITKASLYHHFSGKEDLFIACVTRSFAPAIAAIRQIERQVDLGPRARLHHAIIALYDTMIHSDAGRMSPLIAEVSRSFPNVAKAFHADFISPQKDSIWDMVQQGVAAGVFRAVEKEGFFHLLIGPIVTLSLSREMFTTFPDLDDHFPVNDLRDSHIAAMFVLLDPAQNDAVATVEGPLPRRDPDKGDRRINA